MLALSLSDTLTDVLKEVDTLVLQYAFAESDSSAIAWLALMEPEMLSLKLALVETDSLALIDAEVLSLNDTLTDLLSETDSLALTDSR